MLIPTEDVSQNHQATTQSAVTSCLSQRLVGSLIVGLSHVTTRVTNKAKNRIHVLIQQHRIADPKQRRDSTSYCHHNTLRVLVDCISHIR